MIHEPLEVPTVEAGEQEAGSLLQVVGFLVGGEEYATELLNVVGIERLNDVLQFPNMPATVAGIMRIRDQNVPLVKLRARFGLEEKADDDQTRVVVMELHGQTVGLVVDAVTAVRRLPESDLEAAPLMALTVDSRFVRGVIRFEDQTIILLRPSEIIAAEETRQLGRAGTVASHYAPVEKV